MKVRSDLLVPMSDGVLLSVDIYLPDGGGPHPTVLCRTPYSNQDPMYVDWAISFVESDYAVVIQDCRGRYDSHGEWRPYLDEASDGHDTLEWLGAQEFCNGWISMFGISYVGFTQALAALGGSSYLKSITPIAHQEDNFGHIWYNGTLQLQNVMNFFRLGRRTVQDAVASHLDLDPTYRHLPLVSALDDLTDCPPYKEFLSHPTFDEFWSSYSLKDRYSSIEVPAYFITGWYDNLLHEQFKCYSGLRTSGGSEQARSRTKMLVGPWSHFGIGERSLAGVDFGATAKVDIAAAQRAWFDETLKPAHRSKDGSAPIRLYVMGANEWRDEWEWPLARTVWRRAYLGSSESSDARSSGGRLSWEPPHSDGGSDTYSYNPADPVPTYGGQSMFDENNGPRDRRFVEERSDVIVYTSDPLEESMEVVGPVVLSLYAATDSVDTDFTGVLVDVHPDGRAIHICEGIVRARYRFSNTTPELIEPWEVYEYQISLWETAHRFCRGHRFRLEVSSSNFPRFDRNLNTGDAIGWSTRLKIARQEVFHNARYPSHLTLPTIPAASEAISNG